MDKTWLEELPEELRSSGSLKNFESVADLAKSYVEAQKTLSQRPASISGDEPAHEFFEKTGKALGVKGDIAEYKGIGNENISKVAMRYKLHPRQLKPFLEDIQPEISNMTKKSEEDKTHDWKGKVAYLEKEFKDSDLLRAQAAKRLGTTLSEMQERVGALYNNPDFQHMLLVLGSGDKPVPFQQDGPPKTSSTGKTDPASDSERKTAQEKLNFIAEMQRDGSPYFDKKHADHFKTVQKVEKYTRELSDFQSRTGEEVSL